MSNLIKFVAHLVWNLSWYIRRWTAFKSLCGCKFYTVHCVSLSSVRAMTVIVTTMTRLRRHFYSCVRAILAAACYSKREIKVPWKRVYIRFEITNSHGEKDTPGAILAFYCFIIWNQSFSNFTRRFFIILLSLLLISLIIFNKNTILILVIYHQMCL